MKVAEKTNSFNLLDSPQSLLHLIENHLQDNQHGLPILAVIGPTASAKTSLGIALSRKFNGEIISADSRQIYQGMDIGAATPTKAEQQAAKHHLITFKEPDDLFSLADFQKLAIEVIEKLSYQQKTPILVGGTGLYISSITQRYHLPESKPDFILRRDLTILADQHGKEAVHQQLEKLNPTLAKTIHPNNLRYVIRAIEIETAKQAHLLQPSGPDQSYQGQQENSKNPYHALYLTVEWERAELYERIESRIDQQIKSGLIEETKALLQKYNPNLPALTSLGYQEIIEYLNNQVSIEEAVQKFKQHTRNFAKRQLTWIRRYSNVYSIPGPRLQEFLAILDNSQSE